MAETWQNAMESRDPPTFQQQLLQLRQQQELQQQILMQQFQAQQQQLSEQHEQQLQQHIKHVWWQQLQLMSTSGGGSACSSTTSPPASLPPSGAGRHSSGSGAGPESLPTGSSSGAAHPHDVTMTAHEDVFLEQRLHQHQRHVSEELGNSASSPPAVVSSGSCSAAAAEPPLADWREPLGATGGSSRLELLKKKEVHQQSAVASTEVKQRLQEFVLQKRQREAAAANSPYHSGVRGTLAPQRSFIDKSSSSAHPYRPAAVSKFDEDYCPLRKTASEPNIGLKARIKQRVLDRCSASPSQRRKLQQHQQHLQEHVGPIKLKNKHTLDSSTSTPDSELSSPSGLNYPAQPTANSTIHEEGTSAFSLSMNSSGCVPPLSLYSSPSMPNISLGRPPVHPTSTPNTAPSSADGELALPRHYPSLLPLAGHFLPPFYPVLPVIEGEFTPPTSPAYIHKQMQYLEQQQAAAAAIGRPSNQLLTAAAAAAYLPPGYQAAADPSSHAQEAGRSAPGRPLNRTHSAPLPLGHPMLQNSVAAAAISRQQYELLLRDRRAIYEQQQHSLLKQHIRQTVLTRAGSKTQVENVEEETEAAVAREMQQDSHQHSLTNHSTMVIDLTDGRRASQQDRQEREAGAAPVTSTSSCHLNSPTPDGMGRPGVRALHMIRPLARARSSPLVTLGPTAACTSPDSGSAAELTYVSKQGQGTGLVYDPLMLKHQCVCGEASNHLEHSTRLQAIWSRLQDAELVQRCDRVRSRKATIEELQTCHSQAHAVFFGTNPFSRQKLDLSGLASELPLRSFVKMPCGGVGVDLDTTWNELHTSSAARMATGCVTELAFQVAAGRIGNGFALVRPPGHHAEHQQAMGFCFFNSVAVAARLLRLQLSVEKVLVVDWDVHHGNGTQQIFYDSSHVLYMSLHRHDNGNFFPGTGATIECGAEDGMGFNVNVAWSGGEAMADAEYLAAFRTIVMPIARDFQPDVVLVSSGFDAASGHAAPLGGYQLSPSCFGWMTRQLMSLANGKVVLALEGGYHIPAVCDATEHCVRALLGESLQPLCDDQLNRKPCQSAVETLQKTIAVQIPHWPCVKRTAHLVNVTHSEALRDSTGGAAKAVEAMAGLSVMPQTTNCPPASDNSPPASLISSTVVRSPARQVSGSDEPMEEGDSISK